MTDSYCTVGSTFSRRLQEHLSAEKEPDSRKRRKRLIKLAGAKACAASDAKVKTLHDELVQVKFQLTQLTEKTDQLIEAASSELPCEPPSARHGQDAQLNPNAKEFLPSAVVDEDLYDRLACMRCCKVVIACECEEPLLEFKRCGECGLMAPCSMTPLNDIKAKLLSGVGVEEVTAVEQCHMCLEVALQLFTNVLEDHVDICEECFGYADQETIVPCHASSCDGNGVYHEKCMIPFPQWRFGKKDSDVEDAYVCKECSAQGKLPYRRGDGSCTSSSEADTDEEESGDTLPETALSFDGLVVGMQLGAGRVQSISPAADKFTVEVRLSGGVEIRHHCISKAAPRMLAKQAAREETTLNGMD